MALFRVFPGTAAELNQMPLHDGWAYVVLDEEHEDENGQGIGEWYVDAAIPSILDENNQPIVNRYRLGAAGLIDSEGNLILPDEILRVDGDIIPVGQGGTGLATITANGIVVGNGSDTVQVVSASSEGGALYSQGPNNPPQFGVLPTAYGGIGRKSDFSANETVALTISLYPNQWTLTQDSEGDDIYSQFAIAQIYCGTDKTVDETTKLRTNLVPPMVTYTSNLDEYSNIVRAEATPVEDANRLSTSPGIMFYTYTQPENQIDLIIVDSR